MAMHLQALAGCNRLTDLQYVAPCANTSMMQAVPEADGGFVESSTFCLCDKLRLILTDGSVF